MVTSPVLDLQQVADEAVSGTALDKVPLSSKKGLRGWSTMFLQEVVKQRELALFLHLMEGYRIYHRFYHPTV